MMTAGCATTIDGVPLPADAKVLGKTTGEVTPFSGIWTGSFGGVIRHLMFVESQRGNQVRVVYAISGVPNTQIRPSWLRLSGIVKGQQLQVQADGFTVSYRLGGDNQLYGLFRGSGSVINHMLMRRGLLADLSAKAGPPVWHAGVRTMIRTDLLEADAPVRLETVIHRPSGTGPFPLAVINHGSTGSGRDKNIFGHTWSDDQLASRLVAKGWLVAFVQRRGRGRSDGQYDEGFSANRADGYSCKPDISLAGANRAMADLDAAIKSLRQRADVAGGPVLLGGLSRGGVLSAAWAGRHPDQVAGVINFVGGWLGQGCQTATQVNQTLFKKAASYPGPMLWIYGIGDPFYTIEHSRENFQAFQQAGGRAQWIELNVPGGNGHQVLSASHLWEEAFNAYISQLR